jgi:hypothetical protein
MATRGILSWIQIWPNNTDLTGSPLYTYQNHFHPSRDLYTFSDVPYNSFTMSSVLTDKNNVTNELTITFAATAANVDLVETSITNRYFYQAYVLRWDTSGDGIDDPPLSPPYFTGFLGSAIKASADITTISLVLGRYNNTTNADFPWRKIPWTILGPLALRK